ncbi:MAG: hypothetical protein LBJ64_07675 [Deltaproteobacteria bacterium]|jgi:predicted transcriptional regulator|nr:hypothetical protein [Deltaproteobacteria bacterium]
MKRADMLAFIFSLNEADMAEVLRKHFTENPESIKKVYLLAKSVSDRFDPEAISQEIFCGLDQFGFKDLNARAGRTRHGYVHPNDAVGEMFQEVMDPVLDEMRKKIKQGLSGAAKAYCVGIIQGLWEYETQSSSEISDWFVDLPADAAREALEEWLASEPSEEDKAEVDGLFPELWRE